MEKATPRSKRFPVPGPQQNLQSATDRAVRSLGRQSAEQIVWLGATGADARWRLPVLDDVLIVDTAAGSVATSAGAEVSPVWRILVLHYLAISGRPAAREPAVTLADLSSGRGYWSVYQGRVIGRLCGTVGRDRASLLAAAAALGAREADGGDAAFELDVFPRLSLRLVWHAADEEFPASATFLLPDNIEEFFCTEDIVVLSECCVARLAGRPF